MYNHIKIIHTCKCTCCAVDECKNHCINCVLRVWFFPLLSQHFKSLWKTKCKCLLTATYFHIWLCFYHLLFSVYLNDKAKYKGNGNSFEPNFVSSDSEYVSKKQVSLARYLVSHFIFGVVWNVFKYHFLN